MDPANERNAVIAELKRAIDLLGASLKPVLVPKEGAQIGYAIRGARDKNGIAAVNGRIFTAGKNTGPCSFGPDEEIARVILTVMKFDPARRSAALIKFSERAIDVLDGDLFLECANYDTARAPPAISTMDWGIASCCRDGVPDVIYSEPRGNCADFLILLGEDPVAVTNNIIICSNRI